MLRPMGLRTEKMAVEIYKKKVCILILIREYAEKHGRRKRRDSKKE